jgi:non-specific serine/threonine protein kinase
MAPSRSSPIVDGSTLSSGGQAITVGSQEWFAWLEQAPGFTYQGASGAFTARRERRARGGYYWKATRWIGGRLRRAYLGKSEALTAQRLADAAAELATVTAPALGTAAPTPTPRLLVLPGKTFGRERELRLAHQLLVENGVRLLTLTGAGGIGKTRLAVAIARQLSAEGQFAGGVHFADLAPIRDPSLVSVAVALALGVSQASRDALAHALHGRREGPILLVLDNCEQVLAGAREVGALLEAVPALSVLATSREALKLRLEQELPVPPLPVPYIGYSERLEQIETNPSVRVFVQAARAIHPDFRLTERNVDAVARLCSRLDGLPLAIEIAAARTKLLSPAAILQHIDQQLDAQARAVDVPARHRTLRATLDWSYELLDLHEQALFRDLAVFAGGATLEAVAAVCGRPATTSQLTPLVESLIEKGLLIKVPPETDGDAAPRVRLLEPVREYALDRLASAEGLASARQRHARFFVNFAEAHVVEDPVYASEYAGLDAELDNLRVAVRWYLERPTREDQYGALRLTAALAEFWHIRGAFGEGIEVAREVLEHVGSIRADPRASEAWVRTAGGLGLLLADRRELDQGQAHLLAALDAARTQGVAPTWLGGILNALGIVARLAGDLETARARFEEVLEVAASGQCPGWECLALTNLGGLLLDVGDTRAAADVLARVLPLVSGLEDTYVPGWVWMHLGNLALLQDQPDLAIDRLLQALPRLAGSRSLHGRTHCLASIACALALQREPERAARLLGAAAAARDPDAVVTRVLQRIIERAERRICEQIGPARYFELLEAGRSLSVEQAISLVVATTVPQADPTENSELSPRETEVASLIADGMTSRQIAQRLVISERTADAHAEHIRTKLGLRSRREIAVWAVQVGLRDPGAQRD